MTKAITIASRTRLAHHRLAAYEAALELLAAVRAADIKDIKLKDQALRAAKSACLNIAEAAAAVEIAAMAHDTAEPHAFLALRLQTAWWRCSPA